MIDDLLPSDALTAKLCVPLFVATRREDVPAGVARWVSVDGTVPGASIVWDHHATGERTNLMVIPDEVALETFDGIGTTKADADSVISAAVVLLGGRRAVDARSMEVLESACHWCDHLDAHPQLGEEVNRLGRGLHTSISVALVAAGVARASDEYAAQVRGLVRVLAERATLPFDDGAELQERRALEVDQAGRVRRAGAIALVDLRGIPPVEPLALYRQHRCAIGIVLAEHPRGGRQYVVGLNPVVAERPESILAALDALAAREHGYGPPCLAATPVPGSENWGGRAVVCGSPWNYGSRLSEDEVIAVVSEALRLFAG